MIAELRARHRRAWLALAMLLPAILVLAWRARRAPVWMEKIPATLQEALKR